MAPLATVPETGAKSDGGADSTGSSNSASSTGAGCGATSGSCGAGSGPGCGLPLAIGVARGGSGAGSGCHSLAGALAAAAGAAAAWPGRPPFSTKPWPGTTPARRSETGSACTAVPSAPPIASQSNVPGTIWSTQVSACSPERWRTSPPTLTVHRTGPRRKTTAPSGTGTTIPNGAMSPPMWPRTQLASRAATAVAGASRSAARSATRPRSSLALASVALPREIRTTVSPNLPTRSLPGSMLTRMVTVNSTQLGTSRGSGGTHSEIAGVAIERIFHKCDSMFA